MRSREFTRIVLGEIELARDDLAAADGCFSQALVRLGALGFPSGIAYVSLGLAEARLAQHDLADAERLLQQELTIYRDTGDSVGQARVLFSWAEVRRRERRFREAVAMLTAVIGICRSTSAHRRHGLALRVLSNVHRDAGNLPDALDAWQRSLELLNATSLPEAAKVAAMIKQHIDITRSAT